MPNIECIHTQSTQETEQFGATVAKRLLKDDTLPRFLALYGDLGVGKTAFVRGFVSVLSPASLVRSPTFALVNEYRGGKYPLFHFDMYRIDSEDDLLSIGFYDYLDRNGICLVEWSEKIPYAMPEEFLRITIQKDKPDEPESRTITLEEVTE